MWRSETVRSGDLSLEASIRVPEKVPAPGIVVCHPHPLYGGDMHNNVVAAISDAASALGFAVLRFNFRGVGASEGSFGGGEGEKNDARAALSHLGSMPATDDRIVLAGYSFGAAVSLVAAPPGLAALVAVSTPTIAVGLADIRVDCPSLLVVGGSDQVAPPERLAGLNQFLRIPPQIETVPGADHFWFGQEETLRELVGRFLARTTTGDEPGAESQ